MKSIIPYSVSLNYLFKNNYNLFEASPTPIIAEDLLGKVIFANKPATDILGYRQHEIVGYNLNVLFPKTEWKDAKKRRTEPLRGEKTVYNDTKFVTNNGIIVALTDEIFPIYSFDQKAIGLMHWLTKEQQEEQPMLYTLLSGCKDGMMLINEAGNIYKINERAENLLDYKNEEIAGKNMQYIVAGRSIEKYAEYWKNRTPGQSDLLNTVELYCRKKGGKEVPVETTFIFIGETVLVNFSDLSEKKQMQRHLRSSSSQLKRFRSELQQYTYVTSHNLREPLHVISNYIDLLQKKYLDKLDAKARHFMDHIIHSADNMDSLLKDLLDFASIEGYTQLEETDCNVLLQEILAEHSLIFNSNAVKLNIAKMPVVMANAPGIKKVFYHLIHNACKFRNEHCTTEVALDVCENKKSWIFSVKDNGIGIDEKDCEKIFLLFKRLHAKEKYPGNGVGLAIAKKIVELHGGKIWVASEPGNGSIFYFSLPKHVSQ